MADSLADEADGLVQDLIGTLVLDELDVTAARARLRKIREVIRDRQHYIEVS